MMRDNYIDGSRRIIEVIELHFRPLQVQFVTLLGDLVAHPVFFAEATLTIFFLKNKKKN